mmetsp:Transcript_118405/g.334681  ORF Transcript_118405/g.334681 Transcript_118405/m.334681 type:complete len:283 (-) Transcript_118405:745-1593(-)
MAPLPSPRVITPTSASETDAVGSAAGGRSLHKTGIEHQERIGRHPSGFQHALLCTSGFQRMDVHPPAVDFWIKCLRRVENTPKTQHATVLKALDLELAQRLGAATNDFPSGGRLAIELEFVLRGAGSVGIVFVPAADRSVACQTGLAISGPGQLPIGLCHVGTTGAVEMAGSAEALLINAPAAHQKRLDEIGVRHQHAAVVPGVQKPLPQALDANFHLSLALRLVTPPFLVAVRGVHAVFQSRQLQAHLHRTVHDVRTDISAETIALEDEAETLARVLEELD